MPSHSVTQFFPSLQFPVSHTFPDTTEAFQKAAFCIRDLMGKQRCAECSAGHHLSVRERTKQHAKIKRADRPCEPGLDSTVPLNFAPFYFKELYSGQHKIYLPTLVFKRSPFPEIKS